MVAVHPGVANDNLELSDGTLVPLVEDAIREIDVKAGRSSSPAAFSGTTR